MSERGDQERERPRAWAGREREGATDLIIEERQAAPVALEREEILMDQRNVAQPSERAAGELAQTEQGLPRWARRGLVGLGVLTPVAVLAVPGVRRPLVRAWQSGASQVVETWQSGTQQAADTAQTGQQRAAWTWWAGRRAVAGTVSEAQAAWRLRQEQRARGQAQEAERRYEQLAEAVEALQRQVAGRDQRRGGFLRRWRPFLLGTVVSGGLGVLYAPRPGAETRAQLRQSAGPLQERATQLTTQARDRAVVVQGQAQQALAQVKERAGTLQGQAQEQLGQVRARAQAGTAPAQGGTAR